MTSLPKKVTLKHFAVLKVTPKLCPLPPSLCIFKSLNFPEGITDNSVWHHLFHFVSTPHLSSTPPAI